MPLYGSTPDYAVLSRKRKARKRKHDEIVRLWQEGQISWNQYCRQEKKYR